jgi:hypothetical protein
MENIRGRQRSWNEGVEITVRTSQLQVVEWLHTNEWQLSSRIQHQSWTVHICIYKIHTVACCLKGQNIGVLILPNSFSNWLNHTLHIPHPESLKSRNYLLFISWEIWIPLWRHMICMGMSPSASHKNEAISPRLTVSRLRDNTNRGSAASRENNTKDLVCLVICIPNRLRFLRFCGTWKHLNNWINKHGAINVD